MRSSPQLVRIFRFGMAFLLVAGVSENSVASDPLPVPQGQPLTDLGWDTAIGGDTSRVRGLPDTPSLEISAGNAPLEISFSLGGLGAAEPLDFSRPFAAGIFPEFQPRVAALTGTASGAGTVSFAVGDRAIGTASLEAHPSPFRFELSPDSAMALSVLAPAETLGTLADLQLEIVPPDVPVETWALLVSYAKLARNFSPATGLVRDRTTVAAGQLDAVPASGMFALAAAALADAGWVRPRYAREVFSKVAGAVALLPHSGGMLPHFVAGGDRAPGSEFSTVDTAIYYHAMLGAAAILGDGEATETLHASVRALEFGPLRLPDGYLSHGFTAGGDVIPYHWRDWGGESALVVALERMADPTSHSRIAETGRVHEGIGFIAEIASLFYPHFDRGEPDKVTGTSWKAARFALADAQRRYTAENSPDTPAALAGYFGYSAGDGREPGTYGASGSDIPGHTWIHPHYLLMATAAHAPPRQARQMLRSLIGHGLLRPWGLVEGFGPHFKTISAANVSLNASFETLAAYHLYARLTGTHNAIYDATESDPLLRAGIGRFYNPSDPERPLAEVPESIR